MEHSFVMGKKLFCTYDEKYFNDSKLAQAKK